MRGRLRKLLGAATRHVNVVHGRTTGRTCIPFNSKSVLEHLDAPHEVKLDIVERATLALEEGDPGLGTCDDNE